MASVVVFMFAFAPEANAQQDFICPAGYEWVYTDSNTRACVKECPVSMKRVGDSCQKNQYERKPYRTFDENGRRISNDAVQSCESDTSRSYRFWFDNGGRQRQGCDAMPYGAYPRCDPGWVASGPGQPCVQTCPAGFPQDPRVPSLCKSPKFVDRSAGQTPPPASPGWVPETEQERLCSVALQPQWIAIGSEWNYLTSENVKAICSGTTNFDRTAACFESERKNAKNIDSLIEACRTGGSSPLLRAQTAPETVPVPPAVVPNPPPVQPVPPPAPAGPDINAVDGRGNNVLHLATQRGDLAAVNEYLGLGFDPSHPNSDRLSAIGIAAANGNSEILMVLLANKYAKPDLAVPALIANNREALLKAVAAKYPIRITNPLFDLAVQRNYLGIALFSLGYGVDPNHAMNYGVRVKDVRFVEGGMQRGGSPDVALKFALDNGHRMLAQDAVDRFKATPNYALELAIPKGDTAIVQFALDRGADANVGMAAAVKSGNEQIVIMLVDKGADPNPAMMLAARSKQAGLMYRLIVAKADARKPEIIGAAAEANNVEIVQMLMRAGADPRWALVPAIQNQNIPLLRELLTAKAVATSQDVLQFAGASGNREIIDLILANGGSRRGYLESMILGAIGNRDPVNTKYLLDKGTDLDYSDLLREAARIGERQNIEMLIDRGANPTAGMFDAVEIGHLETVELLVARKASGADPKLLAMAIAQKNPRMVAVLLNAGANPEAGMKDAYKNGDAAIVALLIQKGAKVTDPSYLLGAVLVGHVELVRVLLEGGAPRDLVDGSGQPLIIIGALTGNVELVKVMLANGVDPNAKNRAGDTALHILGNDRASTGYPKFKEMKKDRLPIIQALVTGGADVNATNAKGETVRKSLGRGKDDVKKIIDPAGAVDKVAP